MSDQTINVLVAFDAETILAKYPNSTDSQNPTYVGSGMIHMIVRESNAVSGNAGDALTISADVDDTIRWRETTVSMDTKYSAILYKFVAASGQDLIDDPRPLISTVTVPLPDKNNPLHPRTQTIQNYFWTTTVLATGNVTYHFQFMIVQHVKDGVNVLGYYQWDPFIQINP